MRTGTAGSTSTTEPSASTTQAGISASTSTLYLSGAIVTLSPPDANPVANTSPRAAMAAITSSSLYPSGLARHSSSGLKFALFTDLGLVCFMAWSASNV